MKVSRRWISSLSDMATISQFIINANQKIVSVELHEFRDANKDGCCLAIYAVVHHSKWISTKLITAKLQRSKIETSIPHFELVTWLITLSEMSVSTSRWCNISKCVVGLTVLWLFIGFQTTARNGNSLFQIELQQSIKGKTHLGDIIQQKATWQTLAAKEQHTFISLV